MYAYSTVQARPGVAHDVPMSRLLLVYDVPMQKKRLVGKTIRRGIKIALGRMSSAFQPKDPCYGPLTESSQQRAAEAHHMGNLDLWDGKLQCTCGKMVGARLSTMNSNFEPYPRPHERYKEPRQRATKRGYEKRARP